MTIGSSVTSIGEQAFYGFDMESIISLIEEPSAIGSKSSDSSPFSLNTFNNATLYVPAGTIDKYKATEGWKDFVFIEEGILNGVKNLNQNQAMPVLIQQDGNYMTISGTPAGTPLRIYDLSGRLINATTATDGVTRVECNSSEKVIIVKVGERTVKVAMGRD